MKWSYRILTLRGIDIRIHLTFPLIVLYAMYEGSRSYAAVWQGALFGAISVCLLFVCVILHELAHSLQSIALGIRVRSITLLPIGGISELSASPERPADELRISIVGPLVSLAIAALLFGIMLVGLRLDWIHDLRHLLRAAQTPSGIGLLVYLMLANLALALFNLIPAFPMDGGRVLRSLLAMAVGPVRALRVASVLGQVLAAGMGLVGVLTGSITLVLVAFFIYAGASLESHSFSAHRLLERMTVADILVPVQTTFPDDLPLGAALELARRSRQQEFPVTFGGSWVGLLHAQDMVKAAQQHPPETPVGKFAHRDFTVFDPSASLLAVQRAVQDTPPHAAAIRSGDGFVGIIGKEDLNRALRLVPAQRKQRTQP